jgi:molybdenum cofactor cytidylyltransferase
VIAAVVLAAGLSRRMGRPKLLLDLAGKPVVRWSVEAVLPHVDDAIVVTGHEDAAVRAALSGLAVRFTVNPHPEGGQGSSIATGIAALAPSTDAALVILGDQPRLPASVVPTLLAAWKKTNKAIVAPSYRGRQGTPVLFAASVFSELAVLGGDVGARAVVGAEPKRVDLIELDASMPADVDTPEDLARLHVE